MFFNKKSFISLLSLAIAVPAQAGSSNTRTTTTTTTTSSGNPKATITLPFSKATGEEIAGGVAVVLALTICWKIYKALGGMKSFQQFLTEANAQATKAVKARDAAEKLAGGKSYKGLSDDDKSGIIDKAYENYVIDNSAKLLSVNGSDFKAYLDSLEGTTFVAKMQTAQSVVQTLSSDPRSAIPDAKPGELPFKSALRYAIQKNVKTQADAGIKAQSFPKTVEVNPATGEGPSGEIGAGIGRGIDNLATGIGQAASNVSTSAYQSLASAARTVQKQAGLASEAYSGQVAARAQAAQSSLQAEQASVVAEQNNVRVLNNDIQRASSASSDDAGDVKPGFEPLDGV